MTFLDAILLTAIAILLTLAAVTLFEASLLLASKLVKRFRLTAAVRADSERMSEAG